MTAMEEVMRANVRKRVQTHIQKMGDREQLMIFSEAILIAKGYKNDALRSAQTVSVYFL